MAEKHADVLRRARTFYTGLPWDSEDKRKIEYLDRRLSTAPKDEQDAADIDACAKTLESVIRPRRPGGFG